MERMWIRIWSPVALLLILALVLAGCGTAAGAGSGEASQDLITVTGVGRARGEPDMATLTIGVNVAEESISEAVDQSNQTIDAVTDALQELGIGADDIQTSNFSIWTEEQWDPETGQRREERLYRVDSTVQITVRQVDSIGEILQASIEAGANNIYGLSFGIDDPSGLAEEARASALENAQAKAQTIADGLGLSLGRIVAVVESPSGPPVLVSEAAAIGLGGGGEPPISSGSLTISSSVQVSFAIEG